MAWIGALGGGAFILASLLLGLRMIWLARRTGGLPERALGLGLLLLGGLGYPLTVVARLAVGLPEGLRLATMVAAQALMLVGLLSTAVFTWRVFRPSSRVAPAVIAGLGLGFVALFGLQCGGDGLGAYTFHNQGIFRWSLPFIGTVMGWTTIEALLFRSALVKRIQLGMGDAVVADRVRLWAIASGTATTINVFSSASQHFGLDPASSPEAAAVTGALGMVAAVSLWLAFFPPPSYRRRVLARSSA